MNTYTAHRRRTQHTDAALSTQTPHSAHSHTVHCRSKHTKPGYNQGRHATDKTYAAIQNDTTPAAGEFARRVRVWVKGKVCTPVVGLMTECLCGLSCQ
jgi:hypothetical protein